MKKIYLSMVAALIASSGFNQSVAQPQASKGIAKPISTPLESIKKKNAAFSSRTTNISRWVSYDDAYSAQMGSTPQLTNMINGPFVNGLDVHMQYDNGGVTVDTAFLGGAHSLIHLSGEFYSNTYFNSNLAPFDPATDLTVDSIFAAVTYEKFDAATVDTAVIRIAVPTANQINGFYSYNPPYNVNTSGDTVYWAAVSFDGANKKLLDAVLEYKVPLDTAFITNSANWLGGDSTWLGIEIAAGDILTGHNGVMDIEVNVIHGKQLTSADTVGKNANFFTPTWIAVDGTNPPEYSENDMTDGGQLYSSNYIANDTNIFYSQWFGNSAQGIIDGGGIDPFQSPYVMVKIEQTNTMTAGIEEVNNGAKLFQNYPNPTSDMTTIKYALENASTVSFEVMDVTGKIVASSYEGNKTEGLHTIELNTNSLNAGVYFYSVVVNGNRLTKKMTISK